MKIASLLSFALLSVTTGGYYLLIKDNQHNLQHSSSENSSDSFEEFDINEMEQKTNILIEKASRALKTFENKIIPLIDKNINTEFAEYLKLPLEEARYNKQNNPFNQNCYTFHKYLNSANSNKFKATSIFFNYQIIKNQDLNINVDNSKAVNKSGFNNFNRLLLLNENFDENNILDILSLYHELIHATEDDFMRRKLVPGQKAQYLDFFKDPLYGENPKLVLPSEALAHGCVIEILNLLLDNLLKESKIKSDNQIDIQKILNKLSLENTNENKDQLMTYLYLAYSLYPNGLIPNKFFNQDFLNRVKEVLSTGSKVNIYDYYPFLNKDGIIEHYWPVLWN